MLAKLSRDTQPQPVWVGLLTTTVLTGVAAGLTYLTQHATATDFGNWTAVVVSVATIALHFANEVVKK